MPDIDGKTTEIYTWIIYSVTCQIVDISGVVTNIINIMCFIKQGFSDPVSISLFGLAISDLGCLLTLIWSNISVTPGVVDADLPFDTIEVSYLVSGMPHYTFSRISCCITAIIVLERCLCIVAPLKVKTIVTRKRVCVVILCTFIILTLTGTPAYAVNKLGMKFSPYRNKTLLGLLSTSDREEVEKVTFAINNFIIPFAAFFVIIICTAVLVINLRRGTEWRKSSVSSVKADVLYRNQKVSKMVVMISTVFISCFVPFSTIMLVLGLEPDLSVNGKNFNVVIVVCGIVLLLESANSSLNIFIYYHMSGNYRKAFNNIFCRS